MANGNGKATFWGFPEENKLLKWIIGILITFFLAFVMHFLGKTSLETEVNANTGKINEQTIEYRHMQEDVGEIKQNIKDINVDMKEQRSMIEEIHREVLRNQ